MGRKEQILRTLDGEYAGYVPVIPVANAFAAKWSGKPMGEIMSNPKLYAQTMIQCRKAFDYDGLWISGFDQDSKLDGAKETIKIMKEEDPDQPIFAIVSNPASTAAVTMDVGKFYVSMIKEPEVVKKVIQQVTEPLVESVRILAETGVDVIWNPMPTLSGTCISRKLYESICRESNIYFNEQVKKCGIRLVAHACGKWDDRFDLLCQEGNHGIHVSECDFQQVCQKYGYEVCLMGNIPSVPVMLLGTPEEVYKRAFHDCTTALAYGTFILSPDCGMPPNVPYENVEAMCRAARDVADIQNRGGK